MNKIEHDFKSYPSIERWTPTKYKLEIFEKIDGTNAQIVVKDNGEVLFGSRTRFLTPFDDNYGFCNHFWNRKDELAKILGAGTHYGEWFGAGIQRRYGLQSKRLALFYRANQDLGELPEDLCVVPKLFEGPLSYDAIEECAKRLREEGSSAVPGFMLPEGMVLRFLGSTHKIILNECQGGKTRDPNQPPKSHPMSFKLSHLLDKNRLSSVISKDSNLNEIQQIGTVARLYFDDVLKELGEQDELEVKLAKKQFYSWYKNIKGW